MRTKWALPLMFLGGLQVCSLPAQAGGGDAVASTEITAQVSLLSKRYTASPYIVQVALFNHTQQTIQGYVDPCPLVYVLKQAGKMVFTYPLKVAMKRPKTCTTELIELNLPPGKATQVYTQTVYSSGDPATKVPKGTYEIKGTFFIRANVGTWKAFEVPLNQKVFVP